MPSILTGWTNMQEENKKSEGVILCTGSRTYSNYNVIARQIGIAIKDLADQGYTKIKVRHGNNIYKDRPSADGLVIEFVNKVRPSLLARGIDVDHDPIRADWETYGRAAGPIRNHDMVDMGLDIGLVFMEQQPTPGTTDCMRYMIQKGHEPRIFREK
jgi:hypothetical protein